LRVLSAKQARIGNQMKCPVDNEPLVMAERSGVEIDYCPRCRGVWLDRGELDKIIERSAMSTSNADHRAPRAGSSDPADRPRKPKKKSSLLGDIFDF